MPATSSADRVVRPAQNLLERVDAFDVRAYWNLILRRRWIILPFFAAALIVTGIVTLKQSKIFDATCTIVIDLAAPKVLDSEQVKDVMDTGVGSYWTTKEYYETQYRVITSRAVATRVAERLQLGTNDRFRGLIGITDAAVRERREKLKDSDPVEILQRHLRVDPVKDSRVVRIRYEDRDPSLAAAIANAIADAYIAENLSVKSTATQNAAEWLERQLAELEQKLDHSGRALFDFKRTHDIVATSWEDRQSMVSQRLTSINDALTRARVRRAELQARNDAIEALGAAVDGDEERAESLTPVAGSAAVQQLRLRYLEAKTECAELNTRYLKEHPKIEACESRLALIRSGLLQQIRTLLAAARADYDDVVTTESNLRRLLNETKTDAFNLNQYERDYLELKRAHDNNQRLYELVLKRLKDTGVTGMLQVSNVRVLDRARPAERPVRPDPFRNLILALVIGLIGGIGLAFAVEHLDTSITSREQIEERLGLSFLGIIPLVSKNPSSADVAVHDQPSSAIAECVRAVRTNLLFMSPEKPLRTILVTSSRPQEGKTMTSAALAEAMAESGNRVLLIDGDMRRPRVHRVFGLRNDVGLSSLVVGDGSLASAARETRIPNLFVLSCGPVPPNPAELLHTQAFASILREASEAFDRVIIDSPPVGVVADAAVMSTQVDGTIMVLRAETTSHDIAARAVRQLRDVNARLLGAVLNGLDIDKRGYGQDYYYSKYGYYGSASSSASNSVSS